MPGPIYTAGRTPLSSDVVAAGGSVQAAPLPSQQVRLVNDAVMTSASLTPIMSQPLVKTETLVDDFASQDTAKWTFFGTAAVSGGQLQLVPTSGYANKIDSVGLYDLTGSSLTVQVVTAPQGTGTIDTFVKLYDPSGAGEVSMLVEGGLLYFAETGGGTTNITYDPVAHLWLRIRHDGTNLLWETAPDGVTWTTRRTKVPALSWSRVTVQLLAGYFGTEPTPGVAVFDNVNTPPAPASASAGNAAAAGAAFNGGPDVRVSAGVAAATATANSPTVAVAPRAGNATGAGVAGNARVAHTFYVDPSGSDSNNGYSTGAAWATIGKVNGTTLGAGDQVLFKRGGTWTSTKLTVSGSGQSGSPILIGAYSTGADPIIDGGGTNTVPGTVDCVLLSGNWITLENVQTQHGNVYGIQITGSDVECRNFTTRNNPVGIEQTNGAARTLIHDFQAIDNNIVITPPGANDDWAANGLTLAGDLAEVYNFNITGSRGVSPDYGFDGSAIEVFAATNALIRDGRASECDAFTELGHSATNNITFRNIEYQCSFSNVIAINLQGTGVFGPVTNIVVTNVTVRQPSLTGTQGVVVNSGATLAIKNCVIESNYLGYMVEPQDEEHNVWFGGAGGSDVLSTHHATQSGIAPTSVIADPLYVDASTGNLRLRPGSPAIDRGIAVSWLTDLDGNPRTVGAAPDAGAYEYQTVAGAASGAATAANAGAALAVSAGVAAATGAASAAAASAGTKPGVAQTTAVAYAPAATTSPQAGVGQAAAAALAPAAGVSVNAGLGQATGTANNATVSTSSSTSAAAGVAASTGTAQAPTVAVAEPAPTATGTATAANAGRSLGPNAGIAAGTGTAVAPSVAVAVLAQTASSTGTANNATVNTSSSTNAAAGVATSTGTAQAPAIAVKTSAVVAVGAGDAQAPTGSIKTSAAVATSSATAPAAGAGVGGSAGSAAAAGTAPNTVESITAGPAVAAGTGAALAASVVTGGDVMVFAGVGTAMGAAAAATVQTGTPATRLVATAAGGPAYITRSRPVATLVAASTAP